MSRMTTTRLPYTDYYLTIRRLQTLDGKVSGKIILAKYTTSNQAYEIKLSRLHIGHTRLTHKHLMSRNVQQPDNNQTLSQGMPLQGGT